MKNLSKSALTCRHPMYSGILLYFISTLLWGGDITVGRTIFSVVNIMYVIIAARMEENNIMQKAKD